MNMEFSYAVLDEFGDVFRKFYSKQMAEHFLETRPEFSIQKLKVKSQAEKLAEFTSIHGDPPF
jgi:hypothetical protein